MTRARLADEWNRGWQPYAIRVEGKLLTPDRCWSTWVETSDGTTKGRSRHNPQEFDVCGWAVRSDLLDTYWRNRLANQLAPRSTTNGQ